MTNAVWVDIREPGTNKLLARYEPQRDIMEFQRRGIKTTVDLMQYKGDNGESRGVTAPAMRLPSGKDVIALDGDTSYRETPNACARPSPFSNQERQGAPDDNDLGGIQDGSRTSQRQG